MSCKTYTRTEPPPWSRFQPLYVCNDPYICKDIIDTKTPNRYNKKGEILQYKKNSVPLTKAQRYANIMNGKKTTRQSMYATQGQTYSNSNTHNLLRVGGIRMTLDGERTLDPVTAPGQYPVVIENFGHLVYNTVRNPHTGEVIVKKPCSMCTPSTASNIPGPRMDIYWNPNPR